MKKILFLIAALFIVTVSFAQKTFYIEKAGHVKYNEDTKEWDYGKSVDVFWKLTILDNIVAIDDGYKTRYKTYNIRTKKETDKYVFVTWNAVDENGSTIVFKMEYYKDETLVMLTAAYLKSGKGYFYIYDTTK